MASPDRVGVAFVDLVAASNVPILPVIWLWKYWLAVGKLQILAGGPGTGKTTIALRIAATLSNGGLSGSTWPDGTPAPFGKVLIWSGEDGLSDTILPRLRAAGANLNHVTIIRGSFEDGKPCSFNFQRHLRSLEEGLHRNGPFALLIIDSLVQATGDSNRNTEVRKALEPLIASAEAHGFAILGLTHVNKGGKAKKPLDSVTGSLAFGAVARVVMLAAAMERDELADRNPYGVLVRVKSNLGPCDGGFAYQVRSQTWQEGSYVIDASSIEWEQEPLEGSAKAILDAASGGSEHTQPSRLEDAKSFLWTLLEHGPISASDAKKRAREAGISGMSLRRAREELRLISEKRNWSGGVMNIWSRPQQPQQHGESPPFVTSIACPQSSGNFATQTQSTLSLPMGGVPLQFTGGYGTPPSSLGFPIVNQSDFRLDCSVYGDLPPKSTEHVEHVEHSHAMEDSFEHINWASYCEVMREARKVRLTLARRMGESDARFVDRIVDQALAGSVVECENDRLIVDELRRVVSRELLRSTSRL